MAVSARRESGGPGDGAGAARGDDAMRALRADIARQLAGRVPKDLRARIDVSDVVQEAVLDALRGLERFEERDPGAMRRWLAAVAENRLRMTVRAHREASKRSSAREMRLDASRTSAPRAIAVSQTSPSQAALRGEERDRVRRAIGALSPAHREVIERVRLRGDSIAEASAAMGRSENAVKKLLARALLDLARELDGAP